MFQLRHNSVNLVTPTNSTLSISWVSNLFNEDDEFIGSRSLPLEMPFCDVNDFALGNAHMLENRSARKQVELLISLFGMPWKKAIYSFKIGKKGYEGFLKIDSGVVGKMITQKLLPEIFINSAQNDVIAFREIALGVTPDQVHASMLSSVEAPGSQPYCFFPVYNEKFFGETTQSQLPGSILNRWHGAGFAWDAVGEDKATEFFTPFFHWKYVITEVCAFLGFEATGDLMADPNFDYVPIYNTGCLSHDQLFMEGKVYPAKHLPKIPLGDFFKKARSRFKLHIHFDYDSRQVFFNYASTLINSTESVDLSDKLFSNFEIGNAQEALYEILEEKDPQDDLYKNYAYIPSAFIGKGDESKKVPTGIGTCFMKTTPNPDVPGSSIRLPAAKMVGNAYGLVAAGQEAATPSGYTKNEFAFRLLHFHGLQDDGAGNFYPYASSDGLAPDGVTVLNPNSLWLLDGNRGILNNFQLAWYQFWLRTEPVTFLSYLNSNEFTSISPLKQILIAGRQRVRVPALMHRIGFDVDGIKKEIASEITVYPIYKQTAIEEAEFTDFTAAPTENAGVTYVRHRKNLFGDPEISLVRYNSGPTIIADAWEFIDVQFFADQACTIPKVVSNLLIKYRREYRGLSVLNYRNYSLTFMIPGTDATGIANLGNAFDENNSGYAHTEHYRRATLFKPKEYFTNKFFLEPSPTNDYVIVL